MSPEVEQVRHHLAVLARQRRTRVLGWPREWRPTEVVNPATGEPFTEAGAWEHIADLLDGGHPLEEVTLVHPPGKRAYVMLEDLRPGSPRLYVKIQLGSGVVIGRSFHLSRFEQ